SPLSRPPPALPPYSALERPPRAALNLLDEADLVAAVPSVQVIGEPGIAFIRGLHQDVGKAAVDQPIGDVVDGGRLVEDPLVLSVVEELDHDDDAVLVGGGDDLVQP